MFTISKQSITAEIHVIGGRIDLKPLLVDSRFQKAQMAILSNVALLAQIHLGKYTATDYTSALSNYFQSQGWLVHY